MRGSIRLSPDDPYPDKGVFMSRGKYRGLISEAAAALRSAPSPAPMRKRVGAPMNSPEATIILGRIVRILPRSAARARARSDMGKEYKRLAGPRELECRPVISEIYRRGCNHKSCSIE